MSASALTTRSEGAGGGTRSEIGSESGFAGRLGAGAARRFDVCRFFFGAGERRFFFGAGADLFFAGRFVFRSSFFARGRAFEGMTSR